MMLRRFTSLLAARAGTQPTRLPAQVRSGGDQAGRSGQ